MVATRYRDLAIWKLGKEIALHAYVLTKGFPDSERYGLISQIRRSAISVPSNIAEGFNRFSSKDFNRFLQISLGSCAELSTQLEISVDLNFTTAKACYLIQDKINHEERMLTSFINRNNPAGAR